MSRLKILVDALGADKSESRLIESTGLVEKVRSSGINDMAMGTTSMLDYHSVLERVG